MLIQITDPFLLPDGTNWTGTIIYTLLYATTLDGATVVGAQQALQVTNGISIQLAPGLYTVQMNQSGLRDVITAQWGVPTSGGPYTVAEISSNVTLQPSGQSGLRAVLTQAQVLALHTTPQILVPAPGVGFSIQPVSIVITQTGTPTYVCDDEAFNFAIGANAVASLGCFKDVGDGGSTAYVQSVGALDQDWFFGNTNLYENLPLIGSTTTNPTGTGGNVIVSVYYNVVPLS